MINPKRPDILDRSVAYSLRIIRLYRELEKDSVGRIVGKQLLRSATGIGANVHEAQGGQSRADFIAKMSIAHKEAYESAYWMRIIAEAGLISDSHLKELQDETEQIVRVLSTILISTKNNDPPKTK